LGVLAWDAGRLNFIGRLWCLVGCGGDRDRGKRPMMAAMAEQHARVGHHAREQGLDAVLTVGEQSRHTADAADGRHFDNKASLFEVLAQMIKTHQEISILVKGARGSRMEDIVEMVKGHQESATC
jgi:UDP-N-acetylmuramyl tripeptide synthase